MSDDVLDDILSSPVLLKAILGIDVLSVPIVHVKKRRRFTYGRSDHYFTSDWWRLLHADDLNDPRSNNNKIFRRRFRVPVPIFHQIVAMAVQLGFEMQPVDAIGQRGVPLQIQILGVLRVLGRDTCFDGIEELSRASQESHRVFFHKFIGLFVRRYFHEFVSTPTGQRLRSTMKVYRRLGFNGCFGSMDGVHVKWDHCSYVLSNMCTGKEHFPTLAFNVIVDHNRFIMSVSSVFFGTYNDKTIVKYDDTVDKLRKKTLFGERVIYKLRNANGELIEHDNPYIICDGGYLKLEYLQTMYKHSSETYTRAWSKRMESVRKDVECTFGILKSRFRCLRHGIRFHDYNQIESVFHMCCILHNMILVHDGLHNRWNADEGKQIQT